MMQPNGSQIPPQQQQPWQMMAPPPQQQQYGAAPHALYQAAPPPPVQYQAAPPAQYPVQYQAPPPPPVPVQYQAAPVQPVQSGVQGGSGDEIKTLWIGDLQYWMDENYVKTCFATTGEVASVKLIRNRQTGNLEGYGFIEFATRATAERVLQTYTGTVMPNTDQAYRLNWASFGSGEKRGDGEDYTIFVGDLAPDVTDSMLHETFRVHYPSVKGAKVVTDRLTNRSKGYGFVRFADVNEQTRAMTEMNGMLCSSRAMRIGPAATKKSMGGQQQYSSNASFQNTQGGTQSESDPNNTTIFVGGLDASVSEDELRRVFSTYGELVHVKIPVGKRCGFVQFVNRSTAEEALLMLNGTQLGGQSIRLSWGRSPSNKPQQQDANQWNGSNYYGYGQGQGYDAYGYGQAAPQDPNMYSYGGYPAYGNYQQQPVNYQQQQ